MIAHDPPTNPGPSFGSGHLTTPLGVIETSPTTSARGRATSSTSTAAPARYSDDDAARTAARTAAPAEPPSCNSSRTDERSTAWLQEDVCMPSGSTAASTACTWRSCLTAGLGSLAASGASAAGGTFGWFTSTPAASAPTRTSSSRCRARCRVTTAPTSTAPSSAPASAERGAARPSAAPEPPSGRRGTWSASSSTTAAPWPAPGRRWCRGRPHGDRQGGRSRERAGGWSIPPTRRGLKMASSFTAGGAKR